MLVNIAKVILILLLINKRTNSKASCVTFTHTNNHFYLFKYLTYIASVHYTFLDINSK